jgi:hypothetical protein
MTMFLTNFLVLKRDRRVHPTMVGKIVVAPTD